MSRTPIRFIQISDTHFFADAKGELLGVPTHQSFEAVMDAVKVYHEKSPIDFLIHSGDLSQDDTEASYKMLAERLSQFNVPVYFVPGNHDDVPLMEKILPNELITLRKHILLPGWQIILLCSQKPKAVEGYLDESQLKFLQECLLKYPDLRAMIVFHHHPLPVGATWIDNLGLQNTDEFWNLVKTYPSVDTVLFGHVHQDFHQLLHGVKCYSSPSTCFQFTRKQNEFGIEDLPPGCRWVECYDDGRLETGVLRVPKYVGVFDVNAKGYK
jgi:Icc protein